MIARKTDADLVRTALRRSRVVALLGPRQCGIEVVPLAELVNAE